MCAPVALGTVSSRYYDHSNRLGSVIAMVNSAGAVTDQYVYTPRLLYFPPYLFVPLSLRPGVAIRYPTSGADYCG